MIDDKYGWEDSDVEWSVASDEKRLPRYVAQVKFSDDQPRDENGRWSGGGGDNQEGTAERCVDCGQMFDPDDDEARCPASDLTAYHRTEEDVPSEKSLATRRVKYSDDEPRDDHGRWTSGGDSGETVQPLGNIPGGQYYGNISEGAKAFVNEQLQKFGVDRDAVRAEIVSRVQANPDAAAQGRAWYGVAHNLASGIERMTGGKVPLATAAAVTAVLSPQTNWAMNAETSARMAQFYADGKAEGLSPEQAAAAFREEWKAQEWGGVGKDGTPRANLCLPENIARGFELLGGPPPTPDEELSSNKIRSFDNNILTGGTVPPPDVTVDVHMGKAFGFASGLDRATTVKLMTAGSDQQARTYANGRTVPDTRVSSVGYTAMASIVREASAQLGMSPAQTQAAYWIAVRDESPEGWKPPRAEWAIDTPFADSLVGANLGGTKALSPDVLHVDEAAGDWDPSDWWTDEEWQREFARQERAISAKSYRAPGIRLRAVGIVEPPTAEPVIAPAPQMCCQDGMTADEHRHASSDGRCCTDVPPTSDDS